MDDGWVHSWMDDGWMDGWMDDGWMNGRTDSRMWYMLTVEYDAAMKRSEALTQAIMWMHLKHMLLSKRSRC